MNSQIYNMKKLSQLEDIEFIETFVISYQKDTRALSAIKEILAKGITIKNLIVFSYQPFLEKQDIERLFNIENVEIINSMSGVTQLIQNIKNFKDILSSDTLYLDISCLNIPELFLLMRYLKTLRPSKKFHVLYSIPFDYHFNEDPFTSFVSYTGDLETREIIGYSGSSEKTRNADLIVFFGFEGSFSLKVIEDINYSELFLVNSLPSFYQKYKDISVINNYDVISQQKKKLSYVPADNPFEVYNFLDDIGNKCPGLCIAPLSTKPVALGVCLYALKYTDVRVVYPVSKFQSETKTHDVHETLIYEIFLEA